MSETTISSETTIPKIGRNWIIAQANALGLVAVLLDESTGFQDNFAMTDFIADEVSDSGYARQSGITLSEQNTDNTSGEEVTFYSTQQITFINNGGFIFSFTHLALIVGGGTSQGDTTGQILYLVRLNGASGVTLNPGKPFKHTATIGFKNVIE